MQFHGLHWLIVCNKPSDGVYRNKCLFYSLTAGTRLLRGYKYEAVMDDKPADISHLVFVIHGIGQKMETGNIVKRAKEYIYFYTVVTSLLSVYMYQWM